MWIKAITTKLAQLSQALSPQLQICPVCGQAGKLAPICPKCTTGLRLVEKQEFCRRCGRFITDINFLQGGACKDCCAQEPAFLEARGVVAYSPYARDMIYRLKYTGVQSLARTMGQLMVQRLIASWSPDQVEGLVPVPMYGPKLRARGFNQAELLAGTVGQLLQRPVWGAALSRVKPTAVQAKLGRTSRIANVRDAIRVGDQVAPLRGKKLILVDDVLTTGSTANACAQALLAEGVQEVRVLVFAAGIYLERSERYDVTQL